MLRIALTIFFVASSTVAQESFKYRCPKGDAVIPASCLEGLQIANVNRQLNATERHQLAYLFAKSYVVSKIKYEQDYYISPDAPISRLMVANFPDFKDTHKEGGLWLGDLFKFFRSQQLYKRDVEKSLRGLSSKQRKLLEQ
jgi:hypothetical protein